MVALPVPERSQEGWNGLGSKGRMVGFLSYHPKPPPIHKLNTTASMGGEIRGSIYIYIFLQKQNFAEVERTGLSSPKQMLYLHLANPVS